MLQPIRYGTIQITANNGLDMELHAITRIINSKLAGSGSLQKLLEEAVVYDKKRTSKIAEVTKDLNVLVEISKAESWDWERTRVAAIAKKSDFNAE